VSKKHLSKIFELRASLLNWEKRMGIDEFSDHKKIILSLLSQIKKFPISINLFKSNDFIQEQMSEASFNRALKDLVEDNLIAINKDPLDKRSLLITKINF
tara:strand:+ start:538 stop:837 length:300 start_codon:yes stop_codon:yes gene_type:complete